MEKLFDQSKFTEWLDFYKADFLGAHWKKERYKWVAAKHFQNHWDIEAVNFAEMLDESLAKAENLLTSANSFPKGMIVSFAGKATETVRAMFRDLFDEGKDVVERIERFKEKSEQVRVEYMSEAKNHYQTENTVTTYLWLRYPDKYYIYKFGEVKGFSKALGSDLIFKPGRYLDNLYNWLKLYNSVHDQLIKDEGLRHMLDEMLDDECYPDPDERTLTSDFGFYVSRAEQKEEPVWADSYDPGLSLQDWESLLSDSQVFNESALEVVQSIHKLGGSATCTQLASAFGHNASFYITNSVTLAKRVQRATGCKVPTRPNGTQAWWPILYLGKNAPKDTEGSFVWMLRPELAKALERLNKGADGKRFWWLNANPKIWSFSETPVGEVQSFTLLNDNGNKRRIYQNFLDARPGDAIIGYESNPVKKIVAVGEIVNGSDGEKITFKKTEVLSNPIDYQDVKQLPELEAMEFFMNPNGSLFKLSPDEYSTIMDLIREQNPISKGSNDVIAPYSKKNFLSEVFMDESDFDRLSRTLSKKKNLILQGAPGTGKTFAAKRLAYAFMGEKDDSRIQFVQFHQNYTYEDFVMGYKPDGEGFKMVSGIFYKFCKRAESNPDKSYYFIIDEINRGNISKIFGELLMLIEADHRGDKLTLAYNGLPFSVPDNLYIIGMMNTADRSLSMIDYALRRRFAFFDMEPAYESSGFKAIIDDMGSNTLINLIGEIKNLNVDIEKDGSLGKGFRIGHSYFCNLDDGSDEELAAIVDLEILPMLEEYWFDDESKVKNWRDRLESAFR